MVSSRLPANLEPNAVARAIAEKRRRGTTYVDLTESNPTKAGFTYPEDLLLPLGHARGLVQVDVRRAAAWNTTRRRSASGPPAQRWRPISGVAAS